MIRVAVLGAAGKMGAEVCRAVNAQTDMTVVASVDKHKAGADFPQAAATGGHVQIADNLKVLSENKAQVAVDFTVAQAAVGNIDWCLENGIHAVVGTTGIPSGELERLESKSRESGANLLIAPNFAIGAVLMMRFAELAAPWLPDAEIIELHHPGKLDAPSGTSLKTADGITRGRKAGTPVPPPGAESIAGARGAEKGGIRVHSVRLPGLVAHQEVIFGGPGQTLTIRHDSIDRSCFMPGVLLAVREIGNRPGLTFGLEHLLGI